MQNSDLSTHQQIMLNLPDSCRGASGGSGKHCRTKPQVLAYGHYAALAVVEEDDQHPHSRYSWLSPTSGILSSRPIAHWASMETWIGIHQKLLRSA